MMHYYQFNIGDYVSHTRHLSLMEDLAFRRLLDFCYLHESPMEGTAEQVARKIGMREQAAEVESVLLEFFVLGDDQRWHNARVERELAAFDEKREAAVRAGKASAKARAGAQLKGNGRSTVVQRSLNVGSTVVQPTSTHEPSDTPNLNQGVREGESARTHDEPKPAEPEPVSAKPAAIAPPVNREGIRLLHFLAEKRIMDLATTERVELANSAASAGVTPDMCRKFLASMKDRGKEPEQCKGLLVSKLRDPASLANWNTSETYLSTKTT